MGALVIGIGAYKYYLRWKADEDRREETRILDQIREERTQRRANNAGAQDRQHTDSSNPDISQCVICLERPREVIVLECGHICMCSDCARELLNPHSGAANARKCPICRADINRLAPAYLS